jgi:hypothetical protein
LSGHAEEFNTVHPEKNNNAKKKKGAQGAPSGKTDLLFRGGLRVSVFLLETLNTTGGIYQLLLAGEKRMTIRADFYAQHIALDCRAGRKRMAARAMHSNVVIIGVNSRLHDSPF